MEKMLMKVQVGPVQEFIAQARSTRDMWAGSYLLAWMTAAAMKVFKEAGCEFIFPALEKQPLYEMFNGNESPEGLIPTLPNVFMLLVSEDQVEELTEKAEAALRRELEKVGDACWKKMIDLGASKDWKPRWDDQLSRFPIFNWHAVVIEDWNPTVEKLGTEMAARRNTRNFEQWIGVPGASKDVLSGKEEIIGSENFWGNEYWKKAGPYGAMNCIKRLFPLAFLEKQFPSKVSFWNEMSMENTRDLALKNREQANPYIAVIAMDGDRMGAALKELKTQEDHTAFSQTLARFAEKEVKPIVDKAGGRLVYAGGDDVLAMCPADQALELAQSLADQFRKTMGCKMDASCGIAVGHYQFPLQRIVEEARRAEARAKNKRGRAAFEMTLLKRSGEIIQWGAKWDSKALPVYRDFTKKVEEKKFSGRFAYALAELLQPYRLGEKTSIEMKPIIQKEFEHVQGRQALEKGAIIEHALEYLQALNEQTLEDFSNLFLASAFMNRQRGEN